MSSSHTHNVETWTHGWSTTLLSRFQLSVSLDERITVMEVFTCTLSLISGNELTYETIDDSMLTAATRTLHHAVAHRKRCSTMQSRTEMLLREDSTPDSTFQLRRLIQSGIELRMQRLLTSFGQLFESWHQERFCATISPSERTRTGIIDPSLLSTNTHLDFNSALTTCRNLTNGYVTTCLEVVSRARRICSRPPIRGGRGGAFHPSLSSHARGRFLPQSNFDRWTS